MERRKHWIQLKHWIQQRLLPQSQLLSAVKFGRSNQAPWNLEWTLQTGWHHEWSRWIAAETSANKYHCLMRQAQMLNLQPATEPAVSHYTSVQQSENILQVQVTWLVATEVRGKSFGLVTKYRHVTTANVTVTRCDAFSLSSVSRTFSALCVYSQFGPHPHPLGYLCAKFHFFHGLHCWSSPT